MKTLEELNEKAWYRFLKVIYILLYLPYFGILILGLFNNGRDYNPEHFPTTVQEVLNDPEFYKVSDYAKKQVLSIIDKDFNNLSYEAQNDVIESINKKPLPTVTLKERYVYDSYYTWNIGKSLKIFLIITACYILMMELIRRAFYYIVLGKVYPMKN